MNVRRVPKCAIKHSKHNRSEKKYAVKAQLLYVGRQTARPVTVRFLFLFLLNAHSTLMPVASQFEKRDIHLRAPRAPFN